MSSIDKYLSLMGKKEKLHPELEESMIRIGNSMWAIRNEFVYSVPHTDSLNAWVNFCYRQKKNIANRYLAGKNTKMTPSEFVFLHERPYRLNGFMKIMDRLDDSEYWSLLGSIWIDSENIWQVRDYWKQLLTENRPFQKMFMSEEDLASYNSLPEKVTCHRGYKTGVNMRGFSFTISKNKAEWFAERYGGEGEVISIMVDKEDVFAYTNQRGEHEVILLNY